MSGNKIDLSRVLQALDCQRLNFYENLTADEQKGYVPLVLMRYMSLLTDQNPNAIYAVLATNDLVNVGFWQLSKYSDLQHKLLCLTGVGSKQYHSWIGTNKTKTSSKLYALVQEHYPHYNQDETNLFLSKFTKESFKDFLTEYALDDSKIKEYVDLWKKIYG